MAADSTRLVVNISDDPRLRYNSTIIKRKVEVRSWGPEIDREITIRMIIKFYANSAGAYGSDAVTAINADATLTAEQKDWQRQTFADREVNYSTRGRWVLADGTPVAEGTSNAITELEYWQRFTLDNVNAITDMNYGAFAAVYAIATAMIQRLDTLKILG